MSFAVGRHAAARPRGRTAVRLVSVWRSRNNGWPRGRRYLEHVCSVCQVKGDLHNEVSMEPHPGWKPLVMECRQSCGWKRRDPNFGSRAKFSGRTKVDPIVPVTAPVLAHLQAQFHSTTTGQDAVRHSSFIGCWSCVIISGPDSIQALCQTTRPRRAVDLPPSTPEAILGLLVSALSSARLVIILPCCCSLPSCRAPRASKARIWTAMWSFMWPPPVMSTVSMSPKTRQRSLSSRGSR